AAPPTPWIGTPRAARLRRASEGPAARPRPAPASRATQSARHAAPPPPPACGRPPGAGSARRRGRRRRSRGERRVRWKARRELYDAPGQERSRRAAGQRRLPGQTDADRAAPERQLVAGDVEVVEPFVVEGTE